MIRLSSPCRWRAGRSLKLLRETGLNERFIAPRWEVVLKSMMMRVVTTFMALSALLVFAAQDQHAVNFVSIVLLPRGCSIREWVKVAPTQRRVCPAFFPASQPPAGRRDP